MFGPPDGWTIWKDHPISKRFVEIVCDKKYADNWD